jgi:uncharacterized membrane protein YeiH
MNVNELSQLAALAGTVAFAATAVLAMAPLRVDLFTALVMGLMTAIGGGTVRDLILREPVSWAHDLSYIWVSLLASTITFVAYRLISRRSILSVLLYLDALGIALFAVQGTAKAWMLGFGLPLAPIILGIITAIGGGLIRDVLAGRDNLLMNRELYAIPVSLGCLLYAVLMSTTSIQPNLVSLICMGLIFGFRASAIHCQLKVPDWFRMPEVPSSD